MSMPLFTRDLVSFSFLVSVRLNRTCLLRPAMLDRFDRFMTFLKNSNGLTLYWVHSRPLLCEMNNGLSYNPYRFFLWRERLLLVISEPHSGHATLRLFSLFGFILCSLRGQLSLMCLVIFPSEIVLPQRHSFMLVPLQILAWFVRLHCRAKTLWHWLQLSLAVFFSCARSCCASPVFVLH